MSGAGIETLFEIDDREPATGPHVLLPDMSYACGGNILTKAGGFMFLGADNFAAVGCGECRTIGPAELLATQRAMQGRQAAAS